MKKTFKANLVALSVAAGLGAFASNANALNWTLSPDADALAFGVTVVSGVNEINFAELATQPAGIYGAGFTYTGPSFSMDFDADLYTWDSYNSTFGYYDAFIVTVSTSDYYWNSSPSDPVAAGASTFVWGGADWSASHTLEHYITAPGGSDSINLSAGNTTYYVSVVLDTSSLPQSDSNYPSWGSFHVTPVPEPETYAMLLAGLGLMGFVARRRKLKVV